MAHLLKPSEEFLVAWPTAEVVHEPAVPEVQIDRMRTKVLPDEVVVEQLQQVCLLLLRKRVESLRDFLVLRLAKLNHPERIGSDHLVDAAHCIERTCMGAGLDVGDHVQGRLVAFGGLDQFPEQPNGEPNVPVDKPVVGWAELAPGDLEVRLRVGAVQAG